MDTSHLISVYGDETLLSAVAACWEARAEALRELNEEETNTIAEKYDKARKLLIEAKRMTE